MTSGVPDIGQLPTVKKTSGGYQEKAFKSDQEASVSIRKALRAANGSLSKAAAILGISGRTLSRYIRRLGLSEGGRFSGPSSASRAVATGEFEALARVGLGAKNRLKVR